MDLQSIPLFRAVRTQLAWLTERQQVIATNVANADTPGYTPNDLEKPDFGSMLAAYESGASGASQIHSGHASHFGGGGGLVQDGRFDTDAAAGWEVSPNGNAVTVEEEMLRMAETQIAYQTATNLYRKGLNMLRVAVRGSGG